MDPDPRRHRHVVADQKAAGAHRRADRRGPGVLRRWDRYDYDGDGNFNEPDGYIDHFQIVHAGGDQADGDPWQGEDAIWSHRWKAFQSTGQGPEGQQGRRHADRDHRHLGRRLHDPAGERRPVRLRPRVRPRPRTARPVRHRRRRRQRRRLVVDHGPEPGLGPGRRRHRHPRRRPRRRGRSCSWAGSTTRSCCPVSAARWTSARTSTTRPRPRPSSSSLPEKTGRHRPRRHRRGQRSGGRGRATTGATPWRASVTLPAGAADADVPGPLEHRGLRADACDYALRRSRRGTGSWTAIPGSITTAAEGNGIDGLPGGLDAGDVRPVGLRRLRRSACASAT